MTKQIDTARLYEDFSKPLKAFIQRRVRDSALAEDLLHDVFLKIHNQIGSIKDADKLASWIYRIAQNSIVDTYRRRREMVPYEKVSAAIEESHSFNDVAERLTPTLRRMADQLPSKYKEAIVLADFEGVKQTELAERRGTSLSGAKSRVQRGRKILKELLLQCCHFEFDRYGTVFDYQPKNCRNCCGNVSNAKC